MMKAALSRRAGIDADYGLRTTERSGIRDYGLRTTDYGLRTTDYGPRTTDYGLPARDEVSILGTANGVFEQVASAIERRRHETSRSAASRGPIRGTLCARLGHCFVLEVPC